MIRHQLFFATLCCVVLCGRAQASESVAVVSLSFNGDVSEGLQKSTRERLRAGLAATGATVAAPDKVRAAIDGRACDDRSCWRKLWVKIGCRWVVGGQLEGEDRSYAIKLWLSDARTGKVLARADDRCDICGLRAMADRIDLMASALRAKLEQAARQPARLVVTTDRPRAVIMVDGKVVGPAPRELVLKAGRYEIRAKLDGYLTATRRVQLVSGVQDSLALQLLKASPPASPLRTVGWLSTGAGALALGAGITLLAVDGSGADCGEAETVPGGQCRRLVNTSAGGVTLTVLGTAALLGGGYLLYRAFFGRREARAPTTRAALSSRSR